MTENGFSTKPTVTRVHAPARRFPCAVSFGRVEVDCDGEDARSGVKYGEVARNVRNWLRPVKYNATPGTFLSSDAAVPRQSPRIPSF